MVPALPVNRLSTNIPPPSFHGRLSPLKLDLFLHGLHFYNSVPMSKSPGFSRRPLQVGAHISLGLCSSSGQASIFAVGDGGAHYFRVIGTSSTNFRITFKHCRFARLAGRCHFGASLAERQRAHRTRRGLELVRQHAGTGRVAGRAGGLQFGRDGQRAGAAAARAGGIGTQGGSAVPGWQQKMPPSLPPWPRVKSSSTPTSR